MNEEKLFEAIADIDENYVVDAHKDIKKKHNAWIKYVAIAAGILFCVAVGSIIAGNHVTNEEKVAASTDISNTTASVFATSSLILYIAIAAIIFVIIFAIVEYRKRKSGNGKNNKEK